MQTRLYTEHELAPEQELELGAEAAQYLGRVLRLKPGERLRLFNGRDGEFDAELLTLGKNRLTLRLGRQRVAMSSAATESPLRLRLVQGVSRGDRMDTVIQKATELGTRRISPVLTQFGMVRFDDKRASKRREHWQRVANSAAEQCGRIQPTAVDLPVRLNDWFGRERLREATRLILDPSGKASLKDALRSDPPAAGASLCLLIGPEGGFSERELDDARVAGFKCVALGPRVLRTETAAIAAVTLAQSVCGDLD
ncbi:MAG: 16S rRNA (uracil(1498)-N(3))-methyltransferase [Pseudomonadota bacterium]